MQNNSVLQRNESITLEQNKVLRNTYWLLALTLGFSAITAGVSALALPPLHWAIFYRCLWPDVPCGKEPLFRHRCCLNIRLHWFNGLLPRSDFKPLPVYRWWPYRHDSFRRYSIGFLCTICICHDNQA